MSMSVQPWLRRADRGESVSGRSSRRMIGPSANAIADLIAFSSSRMFPGQSCWSRACMASVSISVTGVARVDR